MIRGRAAAATGVALVSFGLVGCAAGTASPHDDRPTVRIAEAARPLDAVALAGFLPDAGALAAAVGTAPGGLLGRPVQGGGDLLLSTVSVSEISPPGCVGVAHPLQRTAFAGAPVRSVATNTWAGGGFDGPPVTAAFGVVQLVSPAAAQTWFAQLSAGWRRCNGQTVSRAQSASGAGEVSHVGAVALDGDVLTATVLHASAGTGSPPVLRALALAGDCLTDVEVTDPRAVQDAAAAADVARLVQASLNARR